MRRKVVVFLGWNTFLNFCALLRCLWRVVFWQVLTLIGVVMDLTTPTFNAKLMGSCAVLREIWGDVKMIDHCCDVELFVSVGIFEYFKWLNELWTQTIVLQIFWDDLVGKDHRTLNTFNWTNYRNTNGLKTLWYKMRGNVTTISNGKQLL